MEKREIYLDYAAATPMKKEVVDAMLPFFAENFYNPSSPYLPAKHLKAEYENAKDTLAHAIGARSENLVITSGATEANNLAFTALKKYKNAECLYLITEHDSVRKIAEKYHGQEILVDKNGIVNLQDLKNKITPETALISISLVNNEIGTIQPFNKIVEIIKEEQKHRQKTQNSLPLLLHSDASQALNLIDISVSRLGVDLLTINSAKIYGPKGIGALFAKPTVELSPIIFGGGQENGLRSGTENVASLIGFAEAAELAKTHINSERKRMENLKKIFKNELKNGFEKIKSLGPEIAESVLENNRKQNEKIELKFLGNEKTQLANFCPVSFDGFDAERLIFKLEERGIYVSTGAACAASKGEKSHVLKAIGLSDSEIAGSLRITFGSQTTENDIKYFVSTLAEIIKNEIQRKNKITNNKTVFVGLSGGVDSSVSAKLLKDAGYNVVGVYMKNWSRDLPGMKCPWAEDLADAKRIATKLDIDFKIFDFENEYHDKVVKYMMDEFKAGRTPNPDVMCNEEIKFKLFYDIAREQGADFIATGHYANTENGKLKKAKDENKDQTYFLYRISEEAVAHTIFPVGNLEKPEVKKLAEKFSFDNAYKKESMGVCFVGEANMDSFIKEYLKDEDEKALKTWRENGAEGAEKPVSEYNKYIKSGDLVDLETGEKLGLHDGAILYTIGQRHGLEIGGGLPYYVVKKDMEKNIVYVSKNLNNENLWTTELELEKVFMRNAEEFIKELEAEKSVTKNFQVRLRHRAKLLDAKINFANINAQDLKNGEASVKVIFETKIKRPASGQSCAFYDGETCLGGGIIK